MTTRRRAPRPASSQRAPQPRDRRPWLVVPLFAVIFAAIAIGGSSDASATWDEPIHFTAGYLALTQGDFRVDPSHPPLLRMWAALPSLALPDVTVDSRAIDLAGPRAWLQDAYRFAHEFMYVRNDADALLGPARAMVVTLAVLLGVLVFCWAREWLGVVPAMAALVLFAVEPNLIAHGSLVTTDLGLTTFSFAAVYFLWRACIHRSRGSAAASACFTGLALASKFSAILLAPIVVVLLAVAAWRGEIRSRAACGIAGLTVVTGVAAIWMAYGFRFLPSDTPNWAFQFTETEMALRSPATAAVAAWIDGHRLLPNAYTQGFLYTQTSSQGMPAFLSGALSTDGWWYYFPFAFLIKTPMAVIVLAIAGVLACVRRRRTLGPMTLAFVAVPIAVFVVAGMTSGINIGLRHVLPVYPFVLLLAAVAVRELAAVRSRWMPGVIAIVLVGGVAEFASAYPHSLAFFNRFVGGPENGFRYLADSNLGWGSNLKRLKEWMDRNGVGHVNLAYFGQADPAYYGIDCTHLPGAPGFAIDAVRRPTLPGYVVLSPTIMHGVYAPPHWRLFYEPFRQLPPVALIGNSMRVYWVDRWPSAIDPTDVTTSSETHRMLADALLFGLQWPERAIAHYREHLRHRAGDVDALKNLGIALAANGQPDEAVSTLRTAVEYGPDDGRARLTLARALFGSRDLAGAILHAERAMELLPADAEARNFLGRVRARLAQVSAR